MSNSYAIPEGVTSVAQAAFTECYSLQNVTLPSTLTSLGQFAFAACTSLTNITIPAAVTNMAEYAFSLCTGINGFYFLGDAPTVWPQTFYSDSATAFYLTGATNWGPTLGSLATAVWPLGALR